MKISKKTKIFLIFCFNFIIINLELRVNLEFYKKIRDINVIISSNPKGLAQVVKDLVLRVCSLQGPKFNTSWVQITPWGHTL
jgi:hypothetical protein